MFHRIALALLITVAVAHGPALAQSTAATGEYKDANLSDSVLLEKCNNRFFPVAENRLLSDVPISVFYTKMNGNTSITPAAGLDVVGIWLTPVQPQCEIASPGRALAPAHGLAVHLVASGNISLLALDKPATDDSGNELTEKNLGGFFGGMVGIYVDYRFEAGGHENRIAVGGILGLGGFVGAKESGFVTTLGAGVVLTR